MPFHYIVPSPSTALAKTKPLATERGDNYIGMHRKMCYSMHSKHLPILLCYFALITKGTMLIHSPQECLVWVKKCCRTWLDQNFDASLLTNKL